MAGTRTTRIDQVRVDAATLTGALRAAASFIDPNKKSHRHRINLRAVTFERLSRGGVEDVHGLMVAGGHPTRAIAVLAGTLANPETFAADLSPAAAAQVVKLFAHAGSVELKHDGKQLTVTATDALFDNQRLGVRTLPVQANADAFQVVVRAVTYAATDDVTVELPAAAQGCVAAAAKALGCHTTIVAVSHGQVSGAMVRFGTAGIGFLRASGFAPTSAGRMFESIAEQADVDARWSGTAVTLQHILDGALPTVLPKAPSTDPDEVPVVEVEVGGVDLDTVDDESGEDAA